jgi:hypothetical protein
MKKLTLLLLITLCFSCEKEKAEDCTCTIKEYRSTDQVNWVFYREDPRSGQIKGCSLDGKEDFWTNQAGTIYYKNHYDCK